MSDDFPVLLRPVTQADIPFITNAWLKNGRKMYLVKGVPDKVYYKQHHKLLEQLLPRGLTIIACDPADPSSLYGFLNCEVWDNTLILHYVYVKSHLKCERPRSRKVMGKYVEESGKAGYGIGQKMLEKVLEYEDHLQAIVYTHETAAGREFLERLYEKGVLPHRATYNPYLLFTTMPKDWNHVRVQLDEPL